MTLGGRDKSYRGTKVMKSLEIEYPNEFSKVL